MYVDIAAIRPMEYCVYCNCHYLFQEGGFYVECGALNGEKGSNSLFFERVRKWNGLLIEGDPTNYAELKKINRKAFSINACISPRATPFKVNHDHLQNNILNY